MARVGMLLRRKALNAKIEYQKHVVHYKGFVEGLKAKNVTEWHKELAAWEKDFSQPDPYYVAPSGAHLEP